MNTANSACDYSCKVCSEEFDSMASVLRHELSHVVGGGNNGPPAGRKRHRNGGRPNNNKKRRKGVRYTGPVVDPDMAKLETTVRNALWNCQEGAELSVLCRIFQNDPNLNSQVFMQVSNDLRTVLESAQEGQTWEVQPFGSMITGMALKDSDIDFFLTPDEFVSFNKQFNTVFRTIEYSRVFNKVIPIRGARIPIIKCRHKPTGTNMDLNMSSRHGVFSSRFIAKMFMYDQRIHPLMFIIKIWAKSWGLTQHNNRMSNYCLLLLVVYYLQACRNPILPPLKEFILNTPQQIVDGINFAFNEGYPNRTTNRLNIRELVEGFFKFYADFPFLTHVICPYLGKHVNREEFNDDSVHFPEYRKHLEVMEQKYAELEANAMNNWYRDINKNKLGTDTPLVLQDPFNLNVNVAKGVRAAVFKIFYEQVVSASRICNERGNTSANLLLRLFYEAPPSGLSAELAAAGKYMGITKTAAANAAPGKSSETQGANAAPDDFTCRLTPIETELFYVRLYLRKMNPNKTYEKIDVDKTWSEYVVRFIRQIFVDLYKIKTKTKCNKNGVFRGRLKPTADTWSQKRPDLKKDYATVLREHADYAASVSDKNAGQEPIFGASFSVLTNMTDFSEIHINMRTDEPKNKNMVGVFFRDFTSRARGFLRAYFEKIATEATTDGSFIKY